MKRNQWEFQFSCKDLLAACEAQIEYHGDRMKHWVGERDRAVEDLRASGIEIREHPVTGGIDHSVVLDPEKSAHLGKCESKLKKHHAAVEEFTDWASTFRAQNPDAMMPLHHDDVVFFGLGE